MKFLQKSPALRVSFFEKNRKLKFNLIKIMSYFAKNLNFA